MAAHLQEVFPTIHTFSTLSPIPKFMVWLQDKVQGKSNLVLPEQFIENAKVFFQLYAVKSTEFPGYAMNPDLDQSQSILRHLWGILNDPTLLWMQDQEVSLALKPLVRFNSVFDT